MVTNLMRNHTIKGTCNGMGEELPKDIICWISKYTIFPGMMYATNVSEHEESDGGYGYMFMNKIRTSKLTRIISPQKATESLQKLVTKRHIQT